MGPPAPRRPHGPPRVHLAGLGFCCLLLLLSSSISGAGALRLLELRVPPHTVARLPVQLECRFDMEGETLYSVKWYKDGHEFYRFVPTDTPKQFNFQVHGVHVLMNNSTETLVVLRNVTLATSGRFRCEVSAEGPSFQTVSDHGDMTVVALPKDGPQISGGRGRYQVDDVVRVNCTSKYSHPAAQLVWYINGEQADARYLVGPFRQENADGLEQSTLGLQFRVQQHHFHRGDLKLKCLATIFSVYWKSNEESVEPDKQQRAPALESRESRAPPDKSRADRVHAAGAGSGSSSPVPSASLQCLLLAVALFALAPRPVRTPGSQLATTR